MPFCLYQRGGGATLSVQRVPHGSAMKPFPCECFDIFILNLLNLLLKNFPTKDRKDMRPPFKLCFKAFRGVLRDGLIGGGGAMSQNGSWCKAFDKSLLCSICIKGKKKYCSVSFFFPSKQLRKRQDVAPVRLCSSRKHARQL